MAQYQLHLLDLFDRMGLKQIDLVGISMGGWMAAEFAVRNPHRVRKLVLCCPAGLPSEHRRAAESRQHARRHVRLSGQRSVRCSMRICRRPTQRRLLHAKEVAREAQSGRPFFAAGGPFDPRLERWLHRVTMPTMLVWSRADRLSPYQRHEKWMTLLPNATLKLVDKAGHLVLDESPEALAAITEFLS